MPSGYSGTPLAKKLGIKPGYRILLNIPSANYFKLFDEWSPNIEELPNIQPGNADFIHLFCKSTKELIEAVERHKPALKKSGMLWISWPKGGSTIQTDLKRDFIREYLLDNGLVDVKVAAINEDWSGLKFVYRLKDR